MSEYYNPVRGRNLFDPDSTEPFRLSRSKLDLFINCPRCFYLDRRLGRAQPPGYPFSLNSAVDRLLKKEFDFYRRARQPHPLMIKERINAIPFSHPKLDQWRDALKGGVSYMFPDTNLLITGAVDDIWETPEGHLHVVDYKATSKEEEVSLDKEWQEGYKRQAEIYQWLLRKNGFIVDPTSYFVYCNGRADAMRFDARLEFDIKIIPYKGDDSWIERTIADAWRCLCGEGLKKGQLPESGKDCDYCAYRKAVREVEH